MKSDLVDLEVQFQTQTEKAICVRETEDGKDIWIPKASCQFDGPHVPPRRGDVGILTAPEYVLQDKGLI